MQDLPLGVNGEPDPVVKRSRMKEAGELRLILKYFTEAR